MCRLLTFTFATLIATAHATLSDAQVKVLRTRQVNHMKKRILTELGLNDRPPPIPPRIRRSFASNFGDEVERTSESLRTVYPRKVYLRAVRRTNSALTFAAGINATFPLADSLVFESQSLGIYSNQRIDDAILWLHLVAHNATPAATDNDPHTTVHLRTSICTGNECREADEIFHARTNEPYETVNVTNLMRDFYREPATHLIVVVFQSL